MNGAGDAVLAVIPNGGCGFHRLEVGHALPREVSSHCPDKPQQTQRDASLVDHTTGRMRATMIDPHLAGSQIVAAT